MTESTNWVTVKVPESDREKAKDYRPDGSTFGDCLVAGAERLNDHMASDTAGYLEPQLREDTARRIVDEIRDQLGIEGDGGEVDIPADLFDDFTPYSEREGGPSLDELLAELKGVRELVEQNPELTADELEGRLR